MNINSDLKSYIEEDIYPLYSDNIGGHGLEHIKEVTRRSFELANKFNLEVDYNMVYVIAAFHDIGYKKDPDNHEQVSADIFKQNSKMLEFFSDEQIQVMAEAIVDHRASLEYEARSVYGKLVSSADRETSVERMLERSFNYQKDKHAQENPSVDDIINYSYKKLKSKYGQGGYAKMYYQDDVYQQFIKDMNYLLNDFEAFKKAELKIAQAKSLKRVKD